MELKLQEIIKHPFVKELIEQNEQLAGAIPETQHLAEPKKINLDEIHVPYTIKHRPVFQAGVHNGLLYSWEEMSKPDNYEQFNDLDLFMAEHEDESKNWIGLVKNPSPDDDSQTIFADLEIVDKTAAQKLAYQILNKNGRMGLSPTVDVDKKLSRNGQALAGGPWSFKSESVVLNPAVRATVFNSAEGGNTMKNENETQQLKSSEVAIEKEDLEELKKQAKELQQIKQQQLESEIEKLAAIEIAIGRTREESLSTRKEELLRLSDAERKTLFSTYEWLADELTEKTPEEIWVDELPQELKGKIPPGLRAFIEEKRKKKGEQENARKKKLPEEEDEEAMAHKGMMPQDKKKKYPYPENMATETLSRKSENLVERSRRDLNRFQELSEEKKETNQEFIDFLLQKQGDGHLVGRR